MKREQAKLLALSGVQCAIALLSPSLPAEQGSSADDKKKPAGSREQEQRMATIRATLTTINRWIPFLFTLENDGVDGSCAIYITSEDGKLGQELFFDVRTMKPIKNSPLDKLQSMMGPFLSSVGYSGDLVQKIEQMIQQKNRALIDITELLDNEQLSKFGSRFFMAPQGNFALSDLYSIDRKGFLLQPFTLSKSVAALFNWKYPEKIDEARWAELKDLFQDPEGTIPLAKICAVLYGEKRQEFLQEVRSLFMQRFQADLFSVISYGTYDDVVVKVCVLIERLYGVSIGKTQQDQFFIKKVYWL